MAPIHVSGKLFNFVAVLLGIGMVAIGVIEIMGGLVNPHNLILGRI